MKTWRYFVKIWNAEHATLDADPLKLEQFLEYGC